MQNKITHIPTEHVPFTYRYMYVIYVCLSHRCVITCLLHIVTRTSSSVRNTHSRPSTHTTIHLHVHVLLIQMFYWYTCSIDTHVLLIHDVNLPTRKPHSLISSDQRTTSILYILMTSQAFVWGSHVTWTPNIFMI